MKKVMKLSLGLSSLGVIIAPMMGFLSTSEQHIINKVADGWLTKADETAQIFKSSIVANSFSMNATSVANTFNTQTMRDVSDIDSDNTVLTHNQTVYDYSQASNFMNQINKSPGFNHNDGDSNNEYLFSSLNDIMQALLKSFNSYNKQGDILNPKDGLSADGVDNFLNTLSSWSSVLTLFVSPAQVDSLITKINGLVGPLLNLVLPDPPNLMHLKNDLKLSTYSDIHNYLIAKVAEIVVNFLNPSWNQNQKVFSDPAAYNWSGVTWYNNMSTMLSQAVNWFLTSLKLTTYLQITDLGGIDLDWNLAVNKQVQAKIAQVNRQFGLTSAMFQVDDVVKDGDHYVAKVIGIYDSSANVSYNGKIDVVFTINNDDPVQNQIPAPTTDLSWLNDLIELAYIFSIYMNKMTPSELILDYPDEDHLFSRTMTNMQYINSIKPQQIDTTYLDNNISLIDAFNALKGILVDDPDLYTKRAIKVLFQFEDGTSPSFDKVGVEINLLNIVLGRAAVTFEGEWTNTTNTTNTRNGLVNVLQPIGEALLSSSYVADMLKEIIGSFGFNLINFKNAGNAIGALIASLLADNDHQEFFNGIEESIGNWASFISEVSQDFKQILELLATVANKGAFNHLFTKLMTMNLKTELLPMFGELIQLAGLEDLVENIPSINIYETMHQTLFGNITIGGLVWMILSNYEPILQQLSPVIDMFRVLASNQALDTYAFYDYTTNQQIDDPLAFLGYAGDTSQISDLALVLQMMIAENSENLGIRKSEWSDDMKTLYGAAAWKRILGLESTYGTNNIVDYSLIASLESFGKSTLGTIILKNPLRFLSDKISNNLNQIINDRNKLVVFRTNKSAFTYEFVDYQLTDALETLEYNIKYRVRLNEYNTYHVLVTRDLLISPTKWQISNFNIVT